MSARFWTLMRPKTILQALTLSSVEIFLCVLSLTTGIPILLSFGALAPPALADTLDITELMLWGAALTSGGTFMAVGIILVQPRLERAGAVLLGSGTFVLAVVLAVGGGSFLGIATYGLFSWAMWSRYYVLGRYLKQVNTLRQAITPPDQHDKEMPRPFFFKGRR